MSKLYLTYNDKNKKREYYSYTYNGENPLYIALKDAEIEAYFSKILGTFIASVKSINDSTMELVLASGEIIIIDSCKLFRANDQFDSYFQELQKRIKASLEQSNIEVYKNSLPESFSPRVNRSKNNKNKYLMNDNIVASILLGAPSQELSVDLREENVYNNEVTKGL